MSNATTDVQPRGQVDETSHYPLELDRVAILYQLVLFSLLSNPICKISMHESDFFTDRDRNSDNNCNARYDTVTHCIC
eukprot:3559565-Ditylum_brightwellii.AAC.1